MRTINIYGTGITAIRFFLNCRNSYHINAFIEGKKKLDYLQVGINTSIQVVPFENAENMLKTYYTVVASSESVYWEIKEILEKTYGLIEFENFEYFDTFGKKIAVIYGNCHTLPIRQILSRSRQFSRHYGFYPIKQIQEIKRLGQRKLQSYGMEHCDLFIHQCIRKENVYGTEFSSEELIKRLKVNCRIVAIPNVYRMPRFLFPQVSGDNGIIYNGMNYFAFRDIFIEQYRYLSVKELCEMIQDDCFISSADVLDGKDDFFCKLEEREKQWDFPISKFIMEHMEKEQLFFDPNHPTSIVLEYIAGKVLEILGMEQNLSYADNISILDALEVPLYGAVRKALHMVYPQKFLRRWALSTLDCRPLDIKAYVEQYIKWYYI